MQNGVAILTCNRARRLNVSSRHPMHALSRQRAFACATSPVRRPDHFVDWTFSAGGDLLEFNEALRSERARILALRFNRPVLR